MPLLTPSDHQKRVRPFAHEPRKISRVITLATELITRAEYVETEAEADGSFISGTAATGALRRNQHGTDEGARRPAEAWGGAQASEKPTFWGIACKAVVHDDRLDAVAGAVAHFPRAMMMDSRPVGQGHEGRRDGGGDRGLPRRLQSADLSRHEDQRGPGADLVKPAQHEGAVEFTQGPKMAAKERLVVTDEGSRGIVRGHCPNWTRIATQKFSRKTLSKKRINYTDFGLKAAIQSYAV